MIHFSSVSELERAISVGFARGAQLPQEEVSLDEVMTVIDGEWDIFLEFLSEQSDFDRVYIEGNPTAAIIKSINPDSGKGRCYRYVADHVPISEPIESTLLYGLGLVTQRFSKVFRLVNNLRESDVCRHIDRTLQDGERGLLLYGGSHEKTLVPKLEKLELEIVVYDS